ncbi:hypothetical protein MJ575_23955 [Klebsiella pneumoniae]|nr:hypothetical protein MJ575_23955 [Klebsiella pneumoniae]
MLPQLASRIDFISVGIERPDPVPAGRRPQQYPGRQHV